MKPSEATKQAIIARRKEGATWGEIAREFNVTKNQVAGIMWRAGLNKPKPSKPDVSPWRAHVGSKR